MGAQRRESPANWVLLNSRKKLESFNSADLGDRQNRFSRFLFRVPRSPPFGLKNCKRQNRNSNGLVGQCEGHRNLVQQREDTQHRRSVTAAASPNGPFHAAVP